jgi:hypothetical protein
MVIWTITSLGPGRVTQLKLTFAIDLVHFLEILQISQPAGTRIESLNHTWRDQNIFSKVALTHVTNMCLHDCCLHNWRITSTTCFQYLAHVLHNLWQRKYDTADNCFLNANLKKATYVPAECHTGYPISAFSRCGFSIKFLKYFR